jgi:flagellin
MSFAIHTNTAAEKASFFLGRNNKALQKSLSRLSSGNRITTPSDDAGGLAVSMKLNSAVNRLEGASKNIQNAISFLEVQDGILSTVGELVDRMSELRSLYNDVMKNTSDKATYNREFKDLQVQLYDMSHETFNKVSLFSRYTEKFGNAEVLFDGTTIQDHTMSIFVSADGDAGTKVSIHKAMLLSALTIDTTGGELRPASFGDGNQTNIFRFANSSLDGVGANALINLGNISVGVISAVIQNIAGLRSQNGASMSRLQFAADHVTLLKSNLGAAEGRIMDADVAAESTELSKNNILVQASTSMVAQANSLTGLALTLIQ